MSRFLLFSVYYQKIESNPNLSPLAHLYHLEIGFRHQSWSRDANTGHVTALVINTWQTPRLSAYAVSGRNCAANGYEGNERTSKDTWTTSG